MLVLMLLHMVFGVLIQVHVDFNVTRFVIGALIQLHVIYLFIFSWFAMNVLEFYCLTPTKIS
jgi:hypothetical protein